MRENGKPENLEWVGKFRKGERGTGEWEKEKFRTGKFSKMNGSVKNSGDF